MTHAPTCRQIARSKALWAEYVGPDVSQEQADAEFDRRNFDGRVALIHQLFPDDCTCQEIEA